jgi:hypothetical protein
VFWALAVERGEPLFFSHFSFVPEVPKSPECYALAHPDRIKKFPVIDEPREMRIRDNQSQGEWRRGLEHDAESVYWLLVYWAMVARPKDLPNEDIKVADWAYLLTHRVSLFFSTSLDTHSVYKPLRPLIRKLTDILVVDRHWLPASDVRNNPEYVNEAFQRLILQFILDNRDADFMEHPVSTTLRQSGKVPPGPNGS